MATSPMSPGGDDGGLRVTVLGASGSYPGPGSACSGYLLRYGPTAVWLDAGSGTLANLQGHLPMSAVDAVVLSHEHPDHWSDLEGFYVACRYVQQRPEVPVFAPRGLRDLLRTGPFEGTLGWHDIAGGERVQLGGMTWTFARTDHPPETLAARVDAGGRSFGYSADSGSAWTLASLGPDLHLAMCEATFLQDREDSIQHLSARQAGAMAKAAGSARLVITHLWPTIDPEAARSEAAAAYGQPVEVAEANRTYTV